MEPFLAADVRQPLGGHRGGRARRRPRSRRPGRRSPTLLGARPARGRVHRRRHRGRQPGGQGRGPGRACRRRRRRRGHDRVRAQGRARVVRPARGRGLPGRPGRVPALDGVVDARRARRRASTTDTVVVSVMLVNNEVGTIQPLDEIVDARPRAGAARGRAHRRGAGRPVGRRRRARGRRRPGRDLGAQVRRAEGRRRARRARRRRRSSRSSRAAARSGGLRSGTSNVAGVVAMAAALRVTVDAARRRRRAHRATARPARRRPARRGARLVRERRPRAQGRRQRARRLRGRRGRGAARALDHAGVCAAAGSSCSSGATEPSHVLAAMGVPRADALSSIRLSLGFASTDADVDAALAVDPRRGRAPAAPPASPRERRARASSSR